MKVEYQPGDVLTWFRQRPKPAMVLATYLRPSKTGKRAVIRTVDPHGQEHERVVSAEFIERPRPGQEVLRVVPFLLALVVLVLAPVRAVAAVDAVTGFTGYTWSTGVTGPTGQSSQAMLFLSNPAGTYPDLVLTPGAPDPAITQANIQTTICKHGYTASVRNVPASEKLAVLKAYRAKYPFRAAYPAWTDSTGWPACRPLGTVACEYDHLVSLELGGKNDASNLWPQIYQKPGNAPFKTGLWGAREKDFVEDGLHREVCSGKRTLVDAQARIRGDWIAEYRRLKGVAP